jgi:Fe-S cluster biogenesis protein NfuA
MIERKKNSVLVGMDERRGVRLMREEVEKALASIRQFLQADGGDIELVDVTDDGVVKVKLTGACGTCPFSAMTLQMNVQKNLMEQVPGVTKVENVGMPIQ